MTDHTGGRPFLVGTSWKMTKTLTEARSFIEELSETPFPATVQPFVLPAHTALASVRAALPLDSAVWLGAQDAHWAPEGRWTGEVSMRMVRDAGATLVEIGHSERRAHCDDDAAVAAKTRAAVAAGLTPLLCVGEPRRARDAGQERSFVAGQLRSALAGLTPRQVASVLVAYEPIWSIGDGGEVAAPHQVAAMASTVREVGAASSEGAGFGAVLYGGSVDLGNADSLVQEAEVDGLFVGRAAWTASGFRLLLELCAESLRVPVGHTSTRTS